MGGCLLGVPCAGARIAFHQLIFCNAHVRTSMKLIGGKACRLASPLAYTCNSTELYVKSKIAKTIHKYGDTILMCFNVSFFIG